MSDGKVMKKIQRHGAGGTWKMAHPKGGMSTPAFEALIQKIGYVKQ
jgi:hypothetical protein